MNTSESTANIGAALVAAQGELPNVAKTKTARIPTKTGGSYSYRYADLGDVLDAVKPVLTKHGLAVVQEAATQDGATGWVGVTTRIFHTSGEWVEFDALRMPSGADAQSVGSATTYGRRYSLTAALGIAADEDDDGKASGEGTRRLDDAPSSVTPAPGSHGGTERDAGGSGVAGEDASGSSAQHMKPEPHAPDMHAVKAGSSLTRCAFAGCPVAGKVAA